MLSAYLWIQRFTGVAPAKARGHSKLSPCTQAMHYFTVVSQHVCVCVRLKGSKSVITQAKGPADSSVEANDYRTSMDPPPL